VDIIPCPQQGFVLTIAGIICMIEVLALWIITFLLRKVDDGFSINKELRVNFVVWITLGPLFIIIKLLRTDIPIGVFLVALFIVNVAVSGVWPIILSYTNYWSKTFQESSQKKERASLKQILHTKHGFVAFKNFLQSEFTVESLLFWTTVRHFRLSDFRDFTIEEPAPKKTDKLASSTSTDRTSNSDKKPLNPTRGSKEKQQLNLEALGQTLADNCTPIPPPRKEVPTTTSSMPTDIQSITSSFRMSSSMASLASGSLLDLTATEPAKEGTFHDISTLTLKQMEAARQIFDLYIKPVSKMEINISDEIRNAIEENIETGNFQRDMFARAEKAVLYDMAKSGFARFKLTEYYKNYRTEDLKIYRKEQWLEQAKLI